ncbi:TetR/AcrR family transcriptional regulator [Kurthia sibirica]|uniref:TetR/AcrR family transcriptional regulator n=1 Tax=Kurthia sibirica TaxID=202750 RepID=A0A2U3AN63_9BACL|nr:TetR/AcrR family transcriptional regulator [Kurthia sibirica]PWI25968.1 TetR/AcrR family transcriptional regulator [Kurthia sibirica]GEK34999.1 putative HTH-type transcriptional regulator YxaF [Kurthia sibirica]
MTEKISSRDKILHTASRLFHLNGYHATGLSQILKESGAPKGSLYYHFPHGKEQLASEAIDVFKDIIATNIYTNIDLSLDPIIAFQQHLRTIAETFDDIDKIPENAISIPIGLLALETALVNENLRIKCEHTYLLWESIYKDKLIAYGYDEAKATYISSVINCFIEGGITLCLTKKSSKPLRDIIELLPLLLTK